MEINIDNNVYVCIIVWRCECVYVEAGVCVCVCVVWQCVCLL
jgi:hypothetical protein